MLLNSGQAGEERRDRAETRLTQLSAHRFGYTVPDGPQLQGKGLSLLRSHVSSWASWWKAGEWKLQRRLMPLEASVSYHPCQACVSRDETQPSVVWMVLKT